MFLKNELQVYISFKVDNHPITKRTYLNVPGYEKPVEFGMIHSYDYPIADSGN